MVHGRVFRALLFVLLVVSALPLLAQQTGALHGKVQATDGSLLPGVTVEARSNVLPQPRVTTTDTNGDYRMPALIPGNYTLTFTLSGMQSVARKTDVLLGQDMTVDVKLGVAAVSENITVTAETTLVNKESTAIQSGLTGKQIRELPMTQDYRDLQKFIPGVMYTQDTVRGPSAGASGQDNVYMIDGANITMPLFGVLNADPNNHDIDQVNIVRGGAKAVDFNRAGGFLIDSVSKSGTNKFAGEVSYELMNKNFIASQSGAQILTYDQDRSWASANLGGPILADRLFFYGSYYRPYSKRASQVNVYGDLPEYDDKRTDTFGKLTFTPTQSWLMNGSYRHTHETQTAAQFGSQQAPTTGTGFESSQKLGTLETSWVINPQSYATAKLYDWRNPGNGRSDIISPTTINLALGTQLDLAHLGTQGRLTVPTVISTNAAQSAFVSPFIQQYGYICPSNPAQFNLTCTPGVLTGGGTVGFGQFIQDDDSFYRKNGQLGYNYTLGSKTSHDLHVGLQRYKDSEDRFQSSNGWGLLSVPAGVGAAGTCPASACGTATPAFFVAAVSQQGAKNVPAIHSEVSSTNFEINDTIHMNNWSFNVGVLDSQDTLYGQGLAKANNAAGFSTSPGTKYLMHRFEWKDMVQPRLGATWAYNGVDTVYASAARYMSPANSDARAASWDRNLVAQVNAYFDATGKLIGVAPNASSSGKWWQPGVKHPEIKEYMLGTAQQLTNRWSGRLYTRYRKGDHFLEDTNNTARADFNAPNGITHDDYVPNLCNTSIATCAPTTIRGAIGSGSTYVIANLDGAFTKYYEATAESEWHGDNLSVGGSYTWSHYYGNFDQDNSSFSFANDAALFIGSSNIGDGPGRQLWDNKYGNLRGDRRNVLKANATYTLPWRATTGAFFLYQSGQPFQLESALAYRNLTTSTSDTNRYAEAAGARKSPAHHQVDWNYTQNIPFRHGLNFQIAADVFNVFNKQTPYNLETRIGTSGAGSTSALGFIHTTVDTTTPTVPIPNTITDAVLKPILSPNATFNRSEWAVRAPFAQSFYAPRRFQITARVQF
jgi:carboxypeptidase family protein